MKPIVVILEETDVTLPQEIEGDGVAIRGRSDDQRYGAACTAWRGAASSTDPDATERHLLRGQRIVLFLPGLM